MNNFQRSMRFLILLIVSAGLALTGCSGSGPNEANSLANSSEVTVPEYPDAQTAYHEGSKFLETDEIDKAILALGQAVRMNPDLADAYFKLGVAYALVERRDSLNLEAQPETTVSDTGGKERKANSVIAFEKAVEAYKKAIEVNPEDHQAHFNLGLSYNKLNEDQNAAKALREAAKLNPEDTLYQTELGAILIKLAEYREAIGPLKKALELDPENIEAQELLEDAEAGRSRVEYKPTPKPSADNSNTADSNSGTTLPSPAATPAKTPTPAPQRTPAVSNRN